VREIQRWEKIFWISLYCFIGASACVVNVVFKSPSPRLYWNLVLLIMVFGETICLLIYLRRERKTVISKKTMKRRLKKFGKALKSALLGMVHIDLQIDTKDQIEEPEESKS